MSNEKPASLRCNLTFRLMHLHTALFQVGSRDIVRRRAEITGQRACPILRSAGILPSSIFGFMCRVATPRSLMLEKSAIPLRIASRGGVMEIGWILNKLSDYFTDRWAPWKGEDGRTVMIWSECRGLVIWVWDMSFAR